MMTDSATATPMKIRIGRYSRSRLSIDDAPKRARWWAAKGEADTVTQMAGVTGLEPATSGVTGRRSNQLSYTPAAALRGGVYVARKPGGVKQTAGKSAILRTRCNDRCSRGRVVGDEGFEPPTPSV